MIKTKNQLWWVARASSPVERRRSRFGFATLLSSTRPSRSSRQVADRHGLVACATALRGEVTSGSSQSHRTLDSLSTGGQV